MQQIEASLFAAGMSVPALMEKVAGRVARWIATHYPRDRTATVGFIVGPGHNGGDALVVARELYHQGYRVLLWCPFNRVKELTASHKAYLDYLGVPGVESSRDLQVCDLIVDGGFGIGLTRALTGEIATGIDEINGWEIPVVSIDIPSGLETDTGAVLGTAIRARHTLCLGLWKLGLFQDTALSWIGDAHLIPFDVPLKSIQAVVGETLTLRCVSTEAMRSHLPLRRSASAHKYQVGHVLMIAGSRQYAGAALLAGKGAIASGVGMVTLVVPASLKLTVVSQVPEALVVGAPETPSGAIAALSPALDWGKYDVVACGPGLTLQASDLLAQVWECDRPVILDADGLNWLAQHAALERLQQRSAPTLLTPHLGEFRRLFPTLLEHAPTASAAAQQAAQAACCTIVLKGAVSAIAHQNGQLWFNRESTPALARGGSGDVLTGLVAGLVAQHLQNAQFPEQSLLAAAIAAVWWHAQTGRILASERTVLGCSPSELAEHLPSTLAQILASATAQSNDGN
ncbi:MAG: NAD(P)H-hydrate dehydratase [Leptolyngbya sp. SIO1E4]|nr:NAD(P)H-hydrate dehydratase [Leptolyngbya sp. SIO1E4]